MTEEQKALVAREKQLRRVLDTIDSVEPTMLSEDDLLSITNHSMQVRSWLMDDLLSINKVAENRYNTLAKLRRERS